MLNSKIKNLVPFCKKLPKNSYLCRAFHFFHFVSFFFMTIYVGNLAFATTEEELADAFANYGDVQSVKIVKDHETGRSKGFGFVEMTDDASGDRAINAMNGRKLKGRELKVNKAFHKKDMQ